MGCLPHSNGARHALRLALDPNKDKKTMMTENNAVVAIYKSHPEAEAAIKELQQAGFDMKKLSIVGRDYHTDEHVVGYYTTSDRMKYWGGVGAFWGWIWGCLFGSALFIIPGVGPLLLAGPVVGWLVGALGEAVVVGGLSALGAALFSQGIPKNSVLKYETAVKSGTGSDPCPGHYQRNQSRGFGKSSACTVCRRGGHGRSLNRDAGRGLSGPRSPFWLTGLLTALVRQLRQKRARSKILDR
jgi:hypothetical protein